MVVFVSKAIVYECSKVCITVFYTIWSLSCHIFKDNWNSYYKRPKNVQPLHNINIGRASSIGKGFKVKLGGRVKGTAVLSPEPTKNIFVRINNI